MTKHEAVLCLRRLQVYPVLLGLHEMAEVVGVSKQTLCNWMARQDTSGRKVPAPSAQLAMGPIWRSSLIQAWLVQKWMGASDADV